MRAEILAIGDELITGSILDTNSQWLSLALNEIGVMTFFHTTVADDQEAIVETIRIASERADVILMTGGLGPTADDLTRQSIAEHLGVPLERHETLLEEIREKFRSRNREMSKNNEAQAYLPQGTTAIPNLHGTAPGVDATVFRNRRIAGLYDQYRLFAMPGVPSEMKDMWEHETRDRVAAMRNQLEGTQLVFRTMSIHCFGKGESQIEAMLPDIVSRDHLPRVGITANGGTITFRIYGQGRTEEECLQIMQPTRKLIRGTLGTLVFGEGDDRLQDVVARMLRQNGKTLSVVELGTRGLLSEALEDGQELLGGLEFLGGLVVGSWPRFAAEWKLDDSLMHPDNGEQLVLALLTVGKKLFKSDYVLAVGPYPPLVDEGVRARELVWIAGTDGSRTETESHLFAGNPAIMDDLFTKRAMDMLRLKFA